jgi:5-methylthioadenosine/S-adenosylhomocysteine deaminase
MRRAGVRVALGTDGAAANNRLDMVEEMRMAALLQKGAREDASALPAREALWMATRAGGEGLRIGGGTLTVGSEADLVLIDLEQVHTLPVYDPLSALVYAALASDVTDVMVGGRFLLRDGELLTIDEERVKKEVKRLSKRYRN